MIRKLLLSSVALAAVSTASFAADLPNRKSPPAMFVAAPIFTWTGFYVGADIGGGWTNDRVREFTGAGPTGFNSNLNGSGVVGGLFGGYNWQVGSIVLGLETDIEATSINPSVNTAFGAAGALAAGTAGVAERLPWQGSVRGRIGYAFNNILLYGTGGFAYGDVDTKYSAAGVSTRFSGIETGWTLGGGLEYAFNNAWSARIEYRYTQLGSFTDSIGVAQPFWGGFNERHSLSENAVRVGIAYKFGAPASAVVAKY